MSDVDSIPDDPLDALLEEPQDAEPEAQTPEDEATGPPDEDAENKPVKPKRVIKNPRPKLNEQTLKTPRGLPAVQKCFERVKFKGPGHDDKDLDVLLKTYEYWCHRMFPKYPFEACIERLEKLGSKRPTQVYLKRIRMGIADDGNSEVSSGKEDENVPTDGLVDEFDRVTAQPTLNEEVMERIRRNREQAEERRRQRIVRHIGEVEESSGQDLTEEQMERIRINKEKAEMLRKKRLQAAKVTQEEVHEDDPTPMQKHKRLQILNSDEETEDTWVNTTSTVATGEISAEPVEDQTMEDIHGLESSATDKMNAEPIEDGPLDQIMEDINEEPHRNNQTSTTVDKKKNTELVEAEDIQFNQIVENNEDNPAHNKKRRSRVLNSDEEMEETQQ